MVVVDPQGRSGGLALLWREEEQGTLLSFSQHHIDIEVKVEGMAPWRLTGLYGEPDRAQRQKTWDPLRHLARDSNLLWCVIGNLNNVCTQLDKKGGALYPIWLIEGFNDTLTELGLMDMELVGHQFTWEKGRGTLEWQEVRLDRALSTDVWLQLFPIAKVYNLEGSESDHSPLLLVPKKPDSSPYNAKFKFENAWLLEPMCEQIVKDAWCVSTGVDIQSKVALCGEKLQVWGKEITGNFTVRIKECKSELKQLRGLVDKVSVARYNAVKKKLSHTLEQREIFWRQRSKQLWLQTGDQNNKFFHASANSRRRFNRIHKLKNESGEWLEWDTGLPDLITNFYKELFSASQVEWEDVVNCVPTIITAEQNTELLREISDEEVKQALFQMHPDKAPGPDGMTPGFFQKHWKIVGQDVILLVCEFVDTGTLSSCLNETNIVLIPKKKCPTIISELRPISLCNVLARIVTKVLANRMKSLLESVISENQSAFIPGRLITDNMMVSYEIMHYLKRKRRGKGGFMALKLDMSKAYDRVEWGFLRAILLKMGFHARWVNLIMQTVTIVSYKIVHGQNVMGPINPSRRVRQGDPLSPYLFIICAEGLSALIKKNISQKAMSGIKVCNHAPSITHMFFADDSYIYCKANMEEAQNVLNMLKIFEGASGQKINNSKSSVFFSMNMGSNSKTQICDTLCMQEADDRSTYLGLPNVLGRNKSSMLGFIKDKITRKVETWDGNFISKPGKEVLIKSVAQTIPSYAMGVFLLPLEITKDIERTIAKYWWSSKSDGTRGIHWMCWDRLCKHKSTGGLGFRNFRDFNLALLAKQGWRFLTKPNSLVSRLYKARYFPSSDFLNSSLGSNPSFIWRSVWETRELLRSGLRWTIGNGNNIDIVGQPWLNDAVNPYPTSSSESFQNAKISSLFAMNSTDWDMDIIRDLFNVRDQNCIRHTMVEGGLDEDRLYWSKEASGMYTVKSAYRLLQTQKGLWNAADNESLWKQMWTIKAPSKTLNLLWRAMSGCLPTNVQLQHRHVPVLSSCPVCEHEEETTLHILVFCPFAQLCWQLFKPQLLSIQCEDFAGWIAQAMETCNAKTRAELATLCWAIWKARNDKVWRNKKARANYVCSSAMQYLLQWKNAQSKDYKPISHYSREGDGVSLWVKPQGDTIKISVDAACFGQSSAYGSGMVVRDSTGELIYASSKLFHGSASSELAEVIAIREALSWLKNGQWNGVVVESDCLVAIQAIRSRIAMVSPFGRVVATCRKLLEDLVITSLSFIKRSANEAAHYMERESYSFPDRVLNRSNVLIELLNILQVDSSN